MSKILNNITGLLKLHIKELANRVMRGEFGNGRQREQRLGALFHEVQNRVNEMCGCRFRYK